MKTLLFTSVLFLAFISSSTAQKVQQRTLPFFDKIYYEGHGSIFLESSDLPAIKIQTGESNYTREVRTEVIDQTLYIYHDGERGPLDHQRVDIYLYYPDLKGLTVKGQVRVDAIQPVVAEHFELRAEGKVDLRLAFEVQHLNAHTEGNMSISLSGKTHSEHIYFEGQGSVNTLNLQAEEAIVNTQGMGSIYLPEIKKLSATAEGLSEIVYQGATSRKVYLKEHQVTKKGKKI